MIDVKNFGPKDAKIIRENPDADPYVLLTEKGLSEKAYTRLTTGDFKTIPDEPAKAETPAGEPEKATVAPVVTESPESNVMKPSSVVPVAQKPKVVHSLPNQVRPSNMPVANGAVRLYNRETGRYFTASDSAAKRLLRYPEKYSKA